MHYWEMPEHARKLCDRAVELARDFGVSPTPPNYELWFNYAAGSNAELVNALDSAVSGGRAADPAHLRDLHLRFFGNQANAALDDMGSKLQAGLENVSRLLASAGQETAAYGGTLDEAAVLLGRGDVGQIRTIVDGLISATRAVESRQKALENELKSSSDEVESLRRRLEVVRAESTIDTLTGLFNRRGFDERIAGPLRDSDQADVPLALLIGDVDHFKRFNDTWGHATGDQVLRLVAQCFKSNTRECDTPARYGGEEFLVALPRATLESARVVAEKIRKAVETRKIVKRSTGETLGSITLSIGVALRHKGEPIDTTIARADECLYAAKRGGRNRVVAENDADATASKNSATA